MSEQVSSTTAPAPQPAPQANAQAATATTPTPAPQGQGVDALQADLKTLRDRVSLQDEELKRARDEAARYRKRNDDETAQKLKEQGDYKALYEKAAPDLEKAKRYDAWLDREEKRVAKEAEALPKSVQKALAAARDFDSKVEILDEYKREQAEVQAAKQAADAAVAAQAAKAKPATQPVSAPVVGAAPSSPQPAADWKNPTVDQLKALKTADPERHRALMSGQGATPRDGFSFGGLFRRGAGK